MVHTGQNYRCRQEKIIGDAKIYVLQVIIQYSGSTIISHAIHSFTWI